jgi:ferritin
MLISKELNALINAQIGNELGASNQYLSIAAYFSGRTLTKFADFFFAQAAEEHEHAMKFLHYLLEVGAEVKLPEIKAPRANFDSAEDAVLAALSWETDVTKQVYGLVELAQKDKDYISQQFLDWFVKEQLEEISTMETLLALVRMSGSNLLMLEPRLVELREG